MLDLLGGKAMKYLVKKRRIRNKLLIFGLLFVGVTFTNNSHKLLSNLLRLLDSNYDLTTIKIIKTIEKGKAVVTIIEDRQRNKFCVRQIKQKERRMDFSFVREVLASHVAESANIPVSCARILPKELDFPGKYFPKRYGTLQICALGKNKHHRKLRLAQRMKSTFLEKERGLIRQIIACMALHSDLPLIVAFDTFISNPDRTGNNIFYNAKTNRFCGIDLELAFKLPYKRDLGYLAGLRIKEMLSNKVKLNPKELKALKLYTKTLRELSEKNSPMKTYKILQDVASKAGFFCELNDSMHQKFVRYKEKISRQYKNIELLIQLLDQFIATHN